MTVTPPSASPIQPNIALAGQRLDEELRRRRNEPMTMSAAAVEMLEVLHGEYLGDLGQESIRIARRHGLSTVDQSHVKDAAAALGSSPRFATVSNSLNTIGGLLAGAGLAGIYSIFFSSRTTDPTTSELAAAMGLSSMGILLLSVGITLGLVGGKS